MPRIPRVPDAELSPEVARIFASREAGKRAVQSEVHAGQANTNLNAMYTFARIPEIVAPLYALFERLFLDNDASKLDKRLRDLVMVRVTKVNGCRY